MAKFDELNMVYLAENCVFAIEMRLLGVCDEKLRLVGVWPGVCHGKDPAIIELCTVISRMALVIDERTIP